MATCYNKNTPEYQELISKYESPMFVDSLINAWQVINKSTVIPTLFDAEIYLKNEAEFNLMEKTQLAEAILFNLGPKGKGLISRLDGEWYINNTREGAIKGDSVTLNNNKNKVQRILDWWQVDRSAIIMEQTDKSFRIKINPNSLTVTDSIIQSKDTTHLPDIIEHLTRLFPNVNIKVMDEKSARKVYNSLPQFQEVNGKTYQKKPSFANINSFYANGNAILIQGRVTSETAIEEVLHPFVFALYTDKSTLFNSLVKESRNSFPLLYQMIQSTYTDNAGFSKEDRDMELVTQALSRHFKKDYETVPTTSFRSKIKQFMKWLMDIFRDLNKYIIGRDLVIAPGMLDNINTLSDLANILNTSDLQFDIERAIGEDRKVRFKLSDKKQAILNKVRAEATDPKMINVIDDLYKGAETSEVSFDNYSISMSGKRNHPLAIYNKSSNDFINVQSQDIIPSVTSKITGKESPNLITQDFNSIIENAVLKEGVQTDNLNVLDDKTAKDFYNQITQRIATEIKHGGIIIPQTIITDATSDVADAISMLLINADGTLEIINIEAIDYIMDENNPNNKYNKKLIPVKKGSVFYDSKKKKQQAFTKSQLDNLRANSQAQMLANQGRNVVRAGTIYIHIHGKQQFKILDEVTHFSFSKDPSDVLIGNPEDNNFATSQVVKENIDFTAVEKVYNLDKATGEQEASLDEDELIAEKEAIAEGYTERVMALEGMVGSLTKFTKGITTRKEAVERVKNDAVLIKSGKQMKTEIDRMVSIIELGLLEGNVEPVFIEIIRKAIKDLDEFIEYVVDPENYMNDPNYIGKVLNFSKMVKTYEGLGRFKNASEVRGVAQTLIGRLLDKISQINGVRDGVGNVIIGEEGLINDAIDNFGKQFVRDNSSRELSEEDVVDILELGRDIGLAEYWTGTMATSRDTILALMDKVFKRKRQEVLDRVQERNEAIREKASALEKASGGKINFDFMLVLDENGDPVGTYVQKVGKIYFEERKKAAEGLKHDDGEPKEYHIGENLTDQQIKENQELYKAKKKFARFMQAERIIDGKVQDGNFNSYTEEFKEERLKYEYFDGHIWTKKQNVDMEDWLAYRAKYYRSSMYKVPKIGPNGFTGKFKGEKQGWFVKDKYIQKNESAEINGKRVSLLDPKYEKIMNPTDALGRAQKDWYEMYVKYFENDLLEKIPMRVAQQMSGQIPLIKDTTYNNLTKGPNIFATLWSKVKATPGAVRDYFFTKRHNTKIVLTDENGQFVETLPILYVGNPKTEAALKAITDKINAKEQELQKPLTEKQTQEIKYEIEVLKGRRSRLMSKPDRKELSTDLVDSFIKFSSMAENYEVMSGIEDTLNTMIHILDKRGYKPSDGSDIKTYQDGKMVDASMKGKAALDKPRIVQRARKWMKMVFYDNDKTTENFFEKISKNLISYTSLTYVGLNPWGNLNNYIIGRMNNIIETAGGRWYDSKAGIRATREFNNRMLPDFFKKMGGKTMINDVIGLSPGKYDKIIASSKYEALVDLFRMMDNKADIRELNKITGQKEGGFERAWGWGYMLQDAAEWNVQTKVGMAILMSTKIYKSSDPNGSKNIIPLYDAFIFDKDTGEVSLQEGYDTVIDYQTGKHKKWGDDARYDIRQYIREVNIHIHGNYAYEDRMVMQTNALGQLAAQFHKWIAPAIKARYRPEYYDENLGWIQGRYLTFWSFMTHVSKNLMNARQAAKDWKKLKGDTDISVEELDKKIAIKESQRAKTKSPEKQFDIDKEITDLKIQKQGKDKAERYVKNIYRTTAEIGLVLSTVIMRHLFTLLWDDEDEDGRGAIKRFQNAWMYQMDRQRSELLQFVWPGDVVKILKSPISSMRMVEEMGDVLLQSVQTPYVIAKDKIWPGEDIKLNKNIYYQRGPRKGELKFNKEVKDAMPLLYALNRWRGYDQVSNYWVK